MAHVIETLFMGVFVLGVLGFLWSIFGLIMINTLGVESEDTIYTKISFANPIAKIHPKVIEIYDSILADPAHWIIDRFTLSNENANISIWSANNPANRRFYNCPHTEYNSELGWADKILLDRLCIAIRKYYSTIDIPKVNLIPETSAILDVVNLVKSRTVIDIPKVNLIPETGAILDVVNLAKSMTVTE